MKITLTYAGWLEFKGIKSGGTVDVPDGITIADFLSLHHIPPHQQRFLKLFVNREEARLSHALRDGDDLTVIIQVGGG